MAQPTTQADDFMKSPTVSIGLPVHNGEPYLRRAIDSLLAQDYADFELIICDNASTDNTAEICESYARGDKRIRYYRNEINIGVNPNHDRVFELARGEYFAWFSDDVEYLPGMLTRSVEVLKGAHRSVVLVYPRCEMIWNGQARAPEGRSIESKDPRPYKRLQTVVSHVVMVNQLYGLIKREALAKTQLNGLYASSDYVLLAELAMLGEIWEMPETLVRRRIDSDRGTAAVCHDSEAWKAWSGASNRSVKDIWLPQRERLALEYVRAAWSLPLRANDKFACLISILPVYYGRTSRTGRFAVRMTRSWLQRWRSFWRVDRVRSLET